MKNLAEFDPLRSQREKVKSRHFFFTTVFLKKILEYFESDRESISIYPFNFSKVRPEKFKNFYTGTTVNFHASGWTFRRLFRFYTHY